MPIGAPLNTSPRALRAHGVNTTDVSPYVSDRSHALGMRLLNRLPEWDDALECLVLRFQGNRVHFPSARNILLYDEHELEKGKVHKKNCE